MKEEEMNKINVFLSVGTTSTEKQKEFVDALEKRLQNEGIEPYTVGRTSFSSEAPLKAISKLMKESSGTIVIALERLYFPYGIEKKGSKDEKNLKEIKLSTPWNQIEAAMAYSNNHPLMVMVEEGLRNDGLLEYGYDWYVQTIPNSLDLDYLNSKEFNEVLQSWKDKLKKKKKKNINPSELTIYDLIYNMKPSHLWSILVSISALVTGAFLLGSKIIS